MANTTTLSSRFQIYIPKVLTGVECRPLIVGDINMLARRSASNRRADQHRTARPPRVEHYSSAVNTLGVGAKIETRWVARKMHGRRRWAQLGVDSRKSIARPRAAVTTKRFATIPTCGDTRDEGTRIPAA